MSLLEDFDWQQFSKKNDTVPYINHFPLSKVPKSRYVKFKNKEANHICVLISKEWQRYTIGFHKKTERHTQLHYCRIACDSSPAEEDKEVYSITPLQSKEINM